MKKKKKKASARSARLHVSGLYILGGIDAAPIDNPWTDRAVDAEHEGVCGMRREGEEEKKKELCLLLLLPALQAEIRLINSRDNVEMSSMTSILGAVAHCAALQPPLC